jgi:hypothetical protein
MTAPSEIRMIRVGSSDPGQQRRRIERGGQRPRDLRRADVVGDVALQLLGGQPQGAVVFGQAVAGVVAQDNQATIAEPRQNGVAVVFLGTDDAGGRR